MIQSPRYTRRETIGMSALLPLTAAIGTTTGPAAAQQEAAVLVAYYSRTGHTRLIANQIRRARATDLFAIVTRDPYPEDYGQTVAQATRERESGFEPPLAETVRNMASYRTLFLGFPIWGMDAPAAVRSFLSAHDLSGKTIVPFITHGGYGLGNSLNTVRSHAASSDVIEGFSRECEQERRVLEQVTVGWRASRHDRQS
jgi:flavodoxin